MISVERFRISKGCRASKVPLKMRLKDPVGRKGTYKGTFQYSLYNSIIYIALHIVHIKVAILINY